MRRIKFFILFLFIISCTDSEDIIPEVLIRIDRSDVLCDNGGTKFNLGQDNNGSMVLEDIEISTTALFCDDQNDDQILINWEHADQLYGCNGNSGLLVGFFYDWNKDGIFGNENIDLLSICDGFDVENFLFETTQVNLGGVCGGGHEVRIGTDVNGNRLLEDDEVEGSIFIYNRDVFEEKSPIDHTLSINDYQNIAQDYAGTNPEAAQNLAEFNSFHLNLWTTEELDNILYDKITEYGTKVNCQVYNLYYDYFPSNAIGIRAYGYNADLDIYNRM